MVLIEKDLIENVYRQANLPDMFQGYFDSMEAFSKKRMERSFSESEKTENILSDSSEETYQAYVHKGVEMASSLKGMQRQAAYFQIFQRAQTMEHKARIIAKSLEHAETIQYFYTLSRVYKEDMERIPVEEKYTVYASYFLWAALVNMNFSLAQKWWVFLPEKSKEKMALLFFVLQEEAKQKDLEQALLTAKHLSKKAFKSISRQASLLSALGVKFSPQSRLWIKKALSAQAIKQETAEQVLAMEMAAGSNAQAEVLLYAINLLGGEGLNKQNILVVNQVIKTLVVLGYKQEAKRLVIEYMIAVLTHYHY